MGDGNPLRRWRVCVEVSASPSEVLQRLLRERPLWQAELQQEKVLETLDKQTDVYQYSCRNMAPQPSCDYVVLRSGLTTSNTCQEFGGFLVAKKEKSESSDIRMLLN